MGELGGLRKDVVKAAFGFGLGTLDPALIYPYMLVEL